MYKIEIAQKELCEYLISIMPVEWKKICFYSQLKDALNKSPELKAQFSEIQLSQIENGETPDGFVWHHEAETGRMQLVDENIHRDTRHTGGRAIWGGGSDAR